MNLVMLAYYVLCALLLALLGWNFVRERKSRDDLALALLVAIPLLLRLLRIK